MWNLKQTLPIIVIATIFTLHANAQMNHSEYFSDICVERDIPYGKADAWDIYGPGVYNKKELCFDIYSPKTDSNTLRPLVILINGGSFLGSSNKRADVVAWCDSLAKRGYIAAAINYRIGFNPLISGTKIGPRIGMQRAAYRSIQDSRAAIRYFKHHYQKYNIDTTRINLIGSSSGGIIALHTAYMDEGDKLYESKKYGIGANNADLDCIDCSTDLSDEYKNHTCNVNAVISLWGGISDLSFIEAEDSVELLLIHGTADIIVPYNTASVFFFGMHTNMLPELNGSNSIHKYMTSQNINHECSFFVNKHHVIHSDGRIVLKKLNRAVFPGENWTKIFYTGFNFLEKHNKKTPPYKQIVKLGESESDQTKSL